MSVLLVDPSLFTAPYDAALTAGLGAAGVRAHWATRALRTGEPDLLHPASALFYPATDGPRRRSGGGARVLKGLEHALGLARLAGLAARQAADLVHFQWSVIPALDRLAIARLRRRRPVVLTVHDTTPFNGKDVARAQTAGFGALLRSVDGIILHTDGGARAVAALGVDPHRIAVVPHGLLSAPAAAVRTGDARWHVVQFGKLQHYKGADVLVEALGRLGPDDRARLKVTIAGEPLIDTAPLLARATALGLEDVIDWRLEFHSTAAMEALLATADAFVFPYRAIEASGVLYQIAGLDRWVVASDLGAFRERLGAAGDAGALVPPGDPDALAAALVAGIGRRPTRSLTEGVPDWAEIGQMTRDVYARAHASWRAAA